MSGTIALTDGVRWSAAGWLFDWTVRFLAGEVGDPGVAANLQEIVKENLGWVDVGALPPAARTTVLAKLRDDLVASADTQLPATLPERQHVLDHLRELADLAGRVPDS